MRGWISACLILALVVAPASAWPDDAQEAPERLGPRLRLALSRPPARAAKSRRLICTYKQPPDRPAAPCLGRVCAETLDAPAIARLLADPKLERIALPGLYRPRLDRAGPAIGAATARQVHGASGAGVLVAIIDTGLDWSHPDFLDPAGRTRVAWLLDQTLPPSGRHPELESIGVGAVFARTDLEQAQIADPDGAAALGRDEIGHGTHVAGIAVSADPRYTGIAPGAELVAIKALSADGRGFPEDGLLAAMAFARRVAEREGRPMVINLSLGSQLGAHDGSEPIELAIDALAEAEFPPCAVVVAAGNEAGLGQHARAAVRPGGPPLRIEVLVPEHGDPGGGPNPSVTIDLWYDAAAPLTVVVSSPTGAATDATDSAAMASETWTEDGWIGVASAPHPVTPSGPRRILTQIHGEPGLPLAPGVWTITLTGAARRVDAWIGEYDLPSAPLPRFLSHLDDGDLVGPPATARAALAVGAFVSRADWTDADDRSHARDLTLGQLAEFSVRGPTRDGRLKPELVAPGQFVASSLSAAADPRTPRSMFYVGGHQSLVMPDGRHAIASGTSMAAPFAAGVCALAFERDPTLRPEALRDLLAITAASDTLSGLDLFADRWGFGRLAALRMLDHQKLGAMGQFDAQSSLCGAATSWLPADGRETASVVAVPRDRAGMPLGSRLPVSIDGPGLLFNGPTRDLGNGFYLRSLTGQGRRGERLRPVCRLYGQPFGARPEIVLAASEQEAFGKGVGGGAMSCATLPGERSSFAWLVALALLCLSGRSNRNSSKCCTRNNRRNRCSK